MPNTVLIEAQTILTAALFSLLLLTIVTLYLIFSEEPSPETTTDDSSKTASIDCHMLQGSDYKVVCTECSWTGIYFDKEGAYSGEERHYKRNTPKHTCRIQHISDNDTEN